MREEIRRAATAVHSEDLYPERVREVDYDPFDLALPEPKRVADRLCRYMAAQTVLTEDWQLFFGHFRFDPKMDAPSDLFHRTGHAWLQKAASQFIGKPIDNFITFEWQHSTADYGRILKRGIRGCLEDIEAARRLHAGNREKLDYLDGLEMCCHGLVAWAHKCGDACRKEAAAHTGQRKKELTEAADILYCVPEFPATTFREGIQTLWLCYQCLTDSIGTPDRYLYDLYAADMADGRLTRQEAKDYLQCLFVMLQAQTVYYNPNHTRGGECHFTIGGYLPDGSDGFTELSRLIVEALMELPMDIPELSLRWTEKTPHEVLRFMLDAERNDSHKRIALVNDEPRIRSYMKNLNMSFAEACRYTTVGCNEPAFPGTLWKGGVTCNLCHSLEKLLFEGTQKAVACKDYHSFYTLYLRYLQKDLDTFVRITDLFNDIRAKDCNVISSLLMDGCIESATPANRGGCRIKIGGGEWMGLVTVIDSLTVIRQFVYEEKAVTMAHLIEVLRSDWEADPDLHTLIRKKAPFFGNNSPVSQQIAADISNALWEYADSHRLSGGEHILFGTLTGYTPHFAIFGAQTPATPDGRRKGEPLSMGSGQAGGKDRKGLGALLTSVAGIDPSGIFCGPFVLNVTLDSALVRNDESFEKTVDMIESYFRQGGLHIQLNYVSPEELLDAQAHPESYSGLRVRVSGFSDYFVNLCPEIQENVIARTVQGN